MTVYPGGKEPLRKVAGRIEIVHRCECATATEPPSEAGEEHVLRIDGVEFPWYISTKGPVVRRLARGLYTVTVEIVATDVDAVGVHVEDCCHVPVAGPGADDHSVRPESQP